MNKMTLALALSLSLPSTVAFAAGPIVEEVAIQVAPVFSWTGGYVGAHVGYDWASFGHSEPDDPGNNFGADDGGFIGGAYAGYNYQMNNNLVVGGEADFGFTNLGAGPNVGSPLDDYTAFDSNWNAHLRGRLGYAMNRTLFFVAGGVAFADLTSDDTDPNYGGNSSTYVGWTIGAGVEYAATDNLVIRAEYLYDDYGSKDFIIERSGAPILYDAGADMTASIVRFGIAYKF